MTDRPLLFSAPMVNAILEGRKTQTRRIAKPRHKDSLLVESNRPQAWADAYVLDPGNDEWRMRDAPHQVGDRLWIKENYRIDELYDGVKPTKASEHASVWYEAGGYRDWGNVHRPPETHAPDPEDDAPGKLRPSIFMRRCWSRVDLECKGVRLDRLSAISEADAIAEGLIPGQQTVFGRSMRGFYPWLRCPAFYSNPVQAYRHLWNHINGPTAWEENPWVWATSFERIAS